MKTKIISGFPGIGKSYLFNSTSLKVLDSDSSHFSWEKDEKGNNTKVRNKEFPENYIQHIKNNIGKVDVILVSSHKAVRDALVANGIDFTLIYPSISCKGEYLARYVQRGSAKAFVDLLNTMWTSFIDEIENDIREKDIKSIKLTDNQYLEDVIEQIK